MLSLNKDDTDSNGHILEQVMNEPRPRLQVTVPKEVKDAYDRTADIIGIPTSKLVTKMLTETAESVVAMGDALLALKADEEKGLKKLVEFSENAGASFEEQQQDLLEALKKK